MFIFMSCMGRRIRKLIISFDEIGGSMKYSLTLLSSLFTIYLFGALLGCNSSEKSDIKVSDIPIESTVLAQDSVSIAYDARGDGNTTLVFIHGWCSNRTFWREQLDEMAKEYRVVAIDLPGHGESDRNREEWTITSFAEDVKTVVEKLYQERVVLIGHSMGGLVALEATQLMPKNVIGVICVDAISNVESESQSDMMDRVIAAFEADFEGTMNAYMPRMFSPDADSSLVAWATKSSIESDKAMAVSIMRRFSEIDEKDLLSSAGVPVRCIYAAKDDPSGPHSYVEINKKYADFNAVFVDGVGHFLHLENPKEVNHHLFTLLNEIDSLSQ